MLNQRTDIGKGLMQTLETVGDVSQCQGSDNIHTGSRRPLERVQKLQKELTTVRTNYPLMVQDTTSHFHQVEDGVCTSDFVIKIELNVLGIL